MDKITKTIKQLRKQKGFTQKSMAERLQMARSTYSKLESGNTKLDFERLVNISKALDVTIVEIIDDPVYNSISEELTLMLFSTDYQLSGKLCRTTPYEELTAENLQLLRKKGFDNKEKYEDTPLGGRIYAFGPRDVFRFMVEDCGMETLFRSNLIKDSYWTQKYQEYKKQKDKISICLNENGQIEYEDKDHIEIDDRDYFVVFIIELIMQGNKDRWVQISERDFPEGTDERGALEYVINKTGALSGQIMCFSLEGYGPEFEIIK